MATGVYNFRADQPVVWFHRYPSKSNSHCIYCGAHVGATNSKRSNKEHVIGREFVPTGTLGSTSFNFIFRACMECNVEKSNLERHVSTVCLFNSPARASSAQINSNAVRKALKDYHPSMPGTPVASSSRNLSFGNGTVNFTMIAPPQLHPDYVKLLALCHIQAFFSLITTSSPLTDLRLLPEVQFYFHASYAQSDWGNPQLLALVERTRDWPCYCNVETAEGFFRVLLKESPDGSYWFWALEWNKFLRIVGTISDHAFLPSIFAQLPELKWSVFEESNGKFTRTRLNDSLITPDDLFSAIVL